LLGLLSSSCCVLQLILNALSFGCAGFNNVLGPLRPMFLALTLFLQACAWRNAITMRGPSVVSSAIAGSVLCLTLTFLPEALHLYVQRRSSATSRDSKASAARAPTPLEATPLGEAPADELCLRVGGMGCTACTVKVQSALEAVPGVAGCAIELETGSARLRLAPRPVSEDPEASVSSIERRAIMAVEAAGFEATGESMAAGS
jgi:copper chaperone CopZ